MTVDGVRGMRGQEYGGTSELRRIEPATCGCLGTDERVEGMATAISLTLTERSGLRGGDVAWANAVTLDVLFTVLRADVTGEHFQTTLGGSVGTDCLTAQLRHHRADVNDLTLTTLHHLRDNG